VEDPPQVKRSKRVRRVVVSADGHGVVSHAGVVLLREMAGHTGLAEGVTGAARRLRACLLRDTRIRSRRKGSRSSSDKTRLIPPGLTYTDMGI